MKEPLVKVIVTGLLGLLKSRSMPNVLMAIIFVVLYKQDVVDASQSE